MQEVKAHVTAETGTIWTGTAVFDDELARELYRRLSESSPRSESIDSAIAELETRFHEVVYSEIIHLLTHLRFPPDVAKRHWRNIAAHRAEMERSLGTPVDTRVALFRYFVDVDPVLRNPKVIEMSLFEEARDRGFRDALTGLRNYGFFLECLKQEIDRSEQYATPVSLIFIDVDHFKVFNDRYGHEAGNHALVEAARVMSGCTRRSDTLARYGGEEFAVILPQTPKDSAVAVGERLRWSIESHRFRLGAEEEGRALTISLGLAACPADAATLEELIRSADAALYLAKSDGRNCLRLFGNNRRSYPRIDTEVKGRFSVANGEPRPLTTVNLSTGGMLFVADGEITPGALIEAWLELPGTESEIAFLGRVVEARRQESHTETAVRAIEIPAADRRLLARFLRRAQTTKEPEPACGR